MSRPFYRHITCKNQTFFYGLCKIACCSSKKCVFPLLLPLRLKKINPNMCVIIQCIIVQQYSNNLFIFLSITQIAIDQQYSNNLFIYLSITQIAIDQQYSNNISIYLSITQIAIFEYMKLKSVINLKHALSKILFQFSFDCVCMYKLISLGERFKFGHKL